MTLAKSEPFLALQPEGLEIMRANLPALAASPWDMDRAKVPSGGGSTWEIPDLDEGVKAAKSLEGIILHWLSIRSYWQSGLDEGDGASPPDCWSPDGHIGTGNPGGVCLTCFLNAWGSATKGDGKACKEKRILFLLQPNAYLPLLVQVPTMSIRPFNQYMLRLASAGIMYHGVVSGLTLEKSQQRGGGITYSKMAFKKIRVLSDVEIAAVKDLAAQFKAVRPVMEEQALNDA